MVKYGYMYAGGLTLGGLLVTILAGWPWSIPFYVLALFCLNFFRDPDRAVPEGPVAVSPADGKVVAVVPLGGGANRISIFLNIFDVHVNRTPIPGKITCVNYKKGAFLVASVPEASEANEQSILTVKGTVGGVDTQVTFKQIAGLIARRIIIYKKAGDIVDAGERIGLIKFGSRVDVMFGPEWDIMVKTGERVSAASSAIARMRTAPTPTSGEAA
jgi:phosphatidylserine decarboxylase